MSTAFEQFLASRDRLNSLLGTPGDAESQFIRVAPAGSVGDVPALVNAGGDAVITNKGVTVVNGAITVKNAGSTVVIDGTSDMFKIQASGTLSAAWPALGGRSLYAVDLTALGVPTSVPASLVFCSADAAASLQVGSVFDVNTTTGAFIYSVRGYVFIQHFNPPTPDALRVQIDVVDVSRGFGAAALRYYILKEAGL